MTRIPPDIKKAAAALYNRLGCGSVADEAAIAKALMAERERAAGECKRYRDRFAGMPSCAAKTAGDNASQIIENAIRSPQPSPSTGA